MKKYLTLLIILLCIHVIYAEEYTQSQISQEISKADQVISKLQQEGFNTQRLQDNLKIAKEIYDAQIIKPNPDFSVVKQYLDEIFTLEEEAYKAKDEVEFTKKFYNETLQNNPGIDLSEVRPLYDEMIYEFENERYDRAYKLAKQTYSKIVEIEGQYTSLRIAYEATTRSIKDFIYKNRIIILSTLVGLLLLLIIFRNRILYFKTKSKIKRLEKEYKVLEELIKQSQKEYFEKGSIPETTYRIRVRKFSELMRDINRQLPLLREELAKLEKLPSKDKSKKEPAQKRKTKTKKTKKTKQKKK